MQNSRAKFSEVFKRVERRIELDDLREYSCVGVQLYGQSAFVREIKPGAQIKRKTQWVLRTGDFIYNKLFAWKGAFAVVNAPLDGAIVSDKYPTYTFDRQQLDEQFLRYFIQSESLWRQAERYSKGAAALSKFTLNPPDFWKLEMPVPSLTKQRQVVHFLEDTLSRLESIFQQRRPIDAVVQGRRAGIGSECRLIMTSALQTMNDKLGGSLGCLGDVLTLRPRSGPSFPCSESGEGIRVIMPSCLGGYRLDETKSLFGDGGERISDLDLIEEGDLLISRGNKRDQVGLCIVYEPTIQRETTYANLLMRMKTDPSKALPHFVKLWFMAPMSVKYIQANTKGTSPAIQKINQAALLRLPFPCSISLTQQRQWIQYLEKVFDKVEQIELEARKQYAELQEFRRNLLLSVFGR